MNIVFLGKSGVGKSSFINYLLEDNQAATGAGNSVTSKSFKKYSFIDDSKIYMLYDSWGIENGKTKEWLIYLEEFVENKSNSSFKNYIDLFVYCISAESNRVEEFEIQVISCLVNKGFSIVLVITKQNGSNSLDLYNSLKEKFPKLNVLLINNVDSQLGLSKKNKKNICRFGREDFLKLLYENEKKYRKLSFLREKDRMLKSCFKDIYDKIVILSKKNYNIFYKGYIKHHEKKQMIDLVVRNEIELLYNIKALVQNYPDVVLNNNFLDFCRLDKYIDWGLLEQVECSNAYSVFYTMIKESYNDILNSLTSSDIS
ncbi:GTPase domain-containing protein [Myroides marinus]|nr:GTPase domain-containing protein [Myroides marinus]